jgi:hypothetical protein
MIRRSLAFLIAGVLSAAAYAQFDDCRDQFPGKQVPTVAEAGRDLCFDSFAVLYSPKDKKPIYAVEKLNREQLTGDRPVRKEMFYEEARLRASERSTLADYKGTRMDAKKFIEDVAPAMGKYSLINLDPPYYKKGQELYTSFYAPEDHAVLAKSVSRLKKRWIVTYDDAEEIRTLYKKFPMSTNSLNYSAQVKKIGVELMINHPKLDMPILN